MHKHTIVSALALIAFTQTGCGIITHFVQKKKADDGKEDTSVAAKEGPSRALSSFHSGIGGDVVDDD